MRERARVDSLAHLRLRSFLEPDHTAGPGEMLQLVHTNSREPGRPVLLVPSKISDGLVGTREWVFEPRGDAYAIDETRMGNFSHWLLGCERHGPRARSRSGQGARGARGPRRAYAPGEDSDFPARGCDALPQRHPPASHLRTALPRDDRRCAEGRRRHRDGDLETRA